MKKNYLYLLLILCFTFVSSKGWTQSEGGDDFVSIANGTGPTVIIQDVLANDLINGLPATLSNVHIVDVSTTHNYLTLDEETGSVIFQNGPAPIGTYYLSYHYDPIGQVTFNNSAMVTVNIGCDELNAPIPTATGVTCGSNGQVIISGLPAHPDGWWLMDNNSFIVHGFGSTHTLNNVGLWKHSYTVYNHQDCLSPPGVIDLTPLLASAVGTYVDTDSSGAPSVGDHINYTATITNPSVCTVTNINAVQNGMTGGPIASLTSGTSDNSTFTRSYAITQNDINAGHVFKIFMFTGTLGTSPSQLVNTSAPTTNYFNITDGVKLLPFIDTNDNGIMDGEERPFYDGQVKYVINNDGVTHYSSSNTGSVIIYENDPLNSYDFSYTVNNPTYYSGLGTTITYNDVTVANGSGITTFYFPLTIIPFIDAKVDLYGSPPRPGFTYTNTIRYTNSGNQLIPSGTITYSKDSIVTINSISVTGTTTTANGFTYNFSNLLPSESRVITITLQTPTIPTVALGDLVNSSATIDVTGDAFAPNNIDEITQVIVGSYDPNDKAEMHGGKIVHANFTADDYLTYKIRFENTGTFPAEFIRVIDELDDILDETTVQMVDASHAYMLERTGKTLTWFFGDIHLPPSVENTNIGHGYIVFKVKPKPGFELGDSITNIADIYFDFNPAIVTEPCVTEFVALGTKQFSATNLKVYPNPMNNILNVSSDVVIDMVTVTSILGQIVKEQAVNDLKTTVDVTGLASGVYFVKATSQQQSKTVKIIKE